MQKISPSEIKSLADYEQGREAFREQIIALKQHRRVALGDLVTLVFENHQTMLWQIQEMARAERISEPDAIAHEVETYNQLVPDPGELSATLLVEITPLDRLRALLPTLNGLQERIRFEVGGARVPGLAEAGRATEEKMSTVHYLKFRFTPEQQAAFADPAQPVALVADHPRYQERVELPANVRQSLSEDFRE